MEDLTTRAQLVAGSEVGAQSITATVPRSEIESALADDDGPADLILDVARGGDGAGTETRRVAVEWERGDLERLLRQAEGEAVMFAFDRRSLALAFDDPDVDAHGLREKALILTVAAATAAAGAGSAFGGPEMGEGVMSSQGAAAYTPIESARAGEATGAEAPVAGYAGIEAARAAAATDLGTTEGANAGIEAARSAEAQPDPRLGYTGIETVGAEVAAEFANTVQPGEYGMPQATAAEEAAAQGVAAGEYGMPQATAAEQAAAQGVAAGDYGMPQAPSETAGAAGYSAIEAARSTPGTPATSGAGTDSGDSFIAAPDPGTTAALAGMAALAITGAAFMARSRRRLTPSN